MRQHIAFTVVDGGLSTALDAQGLNLLHPLWTGRLITESPEALIEAPRSYLRMGAEAVIATSYQASVAGPEEMGLIRSESGCALRSTTTRAREAGRHDGSAALVAISVGPYGATGAEHRANDDMAGLA